MSLRSSRACWPRSSSALFAVLGLDPVLALFSWLTNVATLGVIVMMAVASLAIVAFFRRQSSAQENALKTTILPALTFIAFVVIIYLITVNFGSLSGAGGFLGVFLPGLVLIAAIVGLLAGDRLERPRSHCLRNSVTSEGLR